jgi:DNA modification methylase
VKTYDEFVAGKVRKIPACGFEPYTLNGHLFEWQKLIVARAIRLGRSAMFEECGLGKTLQQLEWARQVCRHTGKAVLILTPLAVAAQTISEGVRFGIVAKHIREPEDFWPGAINVTNYDRLHKFEHLIPECAGVVLDESSILKNYMGKTRRKLTDMFSGTQYRLCCTATPAPNDFMEFGQHCEFLGTMASNEMLSRWFLNDTMNFGTYRLKGHARKDFWEWVSSWGACVSKPSDLGFEDGAFRLPQLETSLMNVRVDQVAGAAEGEMFRNSTVNASSLFREARLTAKERVGSVADVVNETSEPWIVWCNTNHEADLLAKAMPDAVEVRGSDSLDSKEEKIDAFSTGKARVIVTKPSIAGHGLNWQHCNNVAFVGLSYSFEDFYQALRRSYRFGQQKPVRCVIVQSDAEGNVLKTIKRKMDQHAEMQREMAIATARQLNSEERRLEMNKGIETELGTGWTLHLGDCIRVMKSLPAESIDFSVYSPPFANLYIYSDDVQDMGNTVDQDEFFEQYQFGIAEKFRLTKPGCLSAVHCKNLVEYQGRDGRSGLHDFRGDIIRAHESAGWQYHAEFVIWKDPVIEMQRTKAQGLLFKQLCQNSRYSRAGMPEYVLIFRKWGEGMAENDVEHPIGEADHWKYIGESGPVVSNNERHREIQIWQRYASPVWMDISQTRVLNVSAARDSQDEKHICPMQLDVIDRLIFLYTKAGNVVLSPFAGIGSEGYCAVKMGRKFIGAELKRSYFETACSNLRKAEDEARDLFSLAKSNLQLA